MRPPRIACGEVMTMFWQFLITTLAAWGLLCALWAMLGWLLPGSRPVKLILCAPTPPEVLGRLRWLDQWGLLRCRLTVVGDFPPELPAQYEDVEFCTLAELTAMQEAERREIDGNGNGDPPGRHQRRGVSELR